MGLNIDNIVAVPGRPLHTIGKTLLRLTAAVHYGTAVMCVEFFTLQVIVDPTPLGLLVVNVGFRYADGDVPHKQYLSPLGVDKLRRRLHPWFMAYARKWLADYTTLAGAVAAMPPGMDALEHDRVRAQLEAVQPGDDRPIKEVRCEN